MEQSDYRRRGYTSLHIKSETRQRLNLAKAQLAASGGVTITQDDLLNYLLNRCPEFGSAKSKQNEAAFAN